MPYVVRRLQKMDLTIFHEHSKTIKGRQRAINIDGWLIPYLSIPSPDVSLRFRHPNTKRITSEMHPFGRLQKNYRIHGKMIEGSGFLDYGIGDMMLLRVMGSTVTFGLFRDAGSEQPIFKFLNSAANVTFKRNMGLVSTPNKIRALEELLTDFDAPLFFADEVELLDTEPSSPVLQKFVKRRMTPEAYRNIKRACEKNGDLGETFVLDRERKRLTDAGRSDLASKVKHVAAEEATGPYDILSFEGAAPDPERERFIEVKSTSGDGMDFEISEAEWQFADLKREQHLICRVTQVTSENPKCREIRDIVGHQAAGKATRKPVSYKVKLL